MNQLSQNAENTLEQKGKEWQVVNWKQLIIIKKERFKVEIKIKIKRRKRRREEDEDEHANWPTSRFRRIIKLGKRRMKRD